MTHLEFSVPQNNVGGEFLLYLILPKPSHMATSKKSLNTATYDPFAGIAAPAKRALESKGITNIKKLASFTEKEIAELHGMGPSTIPKLKKALTEAKLKFKPANKNEKETRKNEYKRFSYNCFYSFCILLVNKINLYFRVICVCNFRKYSNQNKN